MKKPKIIKRTLSDGKVKTYFYEIKQSKSSINTLMDIYKTSPEYKFLSDGTKNVYDRSMSILNNHGSVPLNDIDRPFVMRLRDRYADRPATANQIVSFLGLILNFGIDRGLLKVNTALRVKKLPIGEFKCWSPQEIAAALQDAPPSIKTAIMLALYTGQRKGDILAMDWRQYDGSGVSLTQQKTLISLYIPCHTTLRSYLDPIKKDCGPIVVGVNGAPYKEDSFQKAFSRYMNSIGLDAVFHGLRKAAASNLADAGCTEKEIAAITGHKTTSMISFYTKGADQKRNAQAAITKLEAAYG